MAITSKWRTAAILIFCLAVHVHLVNSSQEIVMKLSDSFFKALQECKEELGLTEDLQQTLGRFWHVDTDLGSRNLGCVLICLATKEDLLQPNAYKMHREKTIDYAKEHGADEDTSKTLVDLVHVCEEKHFDDSDHCAWILEVAKCFREEIRQLAWAPTFEDVIAQLMAEA